VNSLQRGEWQKLFSLCFSREEKPPLFRAAIFEKQKTNTAEQENYSQITNLTKEINMQPLILLAALSVMVLYMLTIVGCVCYVGRHRRRTS
jgi:hypothetical protein